MGNVMGVCVSGQDCGADDCGLVAVSRRGYEE